MLPLQGDEHMGGYELKFCCLLRREDVVPRASESLQSLALTEPSLDGFSQTKCWSQSLSITE
jgi:hypothetical protein